MSENGSPRRRRLPRAERAFVEPAKITAYLLDPDHPVGGSKAAYFTRFGFRPEAWTMMEVALLEHAAEGDVVDEQDVPYGRLFAVEGRLVTPDRRNPVVRTVWMLALDDDRPRFVTAYPGRRRRRGGAL